MYFQILFGWVLQQPRSHFYYKQRKEITTTMKDMDFTVSVISVHSVFAAQLRVMAGVDHNFKNFNSYKVFGILQLVVLV